MPFVGARWFRFAGHPVWQELTDLGGAVGGGREFSPFIRAFRGVRGDTPPAWRDKRLNRPSSALWELWEPCNGFQEAGGIAQRFLWARQFSTTGGALLLGDVIVICSLTTCIRYRKVFPKQRGILGKVFPKQRKGDQESVPETAGKTSRNHSDLWVSSGQHRRRIPPQRFSAAQAPSRFAGLSEASLASEQGDYGLA